MPRHAQVAAAFAFSLNLFFCGVASAGPGVLQQPCPRVSARIAYVSPGGLVVCDAGRGGVVLVPHDIGGLVWSDDGNRLRLRLGNVDEPGAPTFAEYNYRTRSLRALSEAAAQAFDKCALAERCVTRRLRAERIDPYDRKPVRDVLAPVRLRLSVDGGAAVTYATPRGGDLAIARLRPDQRGVLFWNEPYRSASAFSDAVPLWDFTSRYRARSYGIDAFPIRDWLAISPSGNALLTISGRAREVFLTPHRLTRCDLVSVRCTLWHARAGYVELDPAWATDGRSAAFVRAPVATAGQLRAGYPSAAWNATRRLIIVDVRTDEEREIGGLDAVFEPRWLSATRLLALAGDRLVDVDTASRRVTIVAAVAADSQLYYGEEAGRGGRLAVFLDHRLRLQ